MMLSTVSGRALKLDAEYGIPHSDFSLSLCCLGDDARACPACDVLPAQVRSSSSVIAPGDDDQAAGGRDEEEEERGSRGEEE